MIDYVCECVCILPHYLLIDFYFILYQPWKLEKIVILNVLPSVKTSCLYLINILRIFRFFFTSPVVRHSENM